MTEDHNDGPTPEALDQRIDGLEQLIAARVRNHTHDEVEATVEQLRTEVDELRSELESERAARQELEQRVRAVTGADSEEQSTAESRRKDLRSALVNRAESNNGKYALYYKEIQDIYESVGHGSLSDTQVFRDMEHLAKEPGFSMGTKPSRTGKEVKAVEVDLEDVPGFPLANDVSNSVAVGTVHQPVPNGGEHNQG